MVIPQRRACTSCEVLETTADETCWICGGPMIPAHLFHNPASSAFLHPMISHLQSTYSHPEETV